MSELDGADHGDSQEDVLTSVDGFRKQKMQKQFSTPKLDLDEGFHESSHSRNNHGKSMSTRRLLAPRRQDDFLRSASSHQLMSRPSSGGAPASFQGSRLAPIDQGSRFTRAGDLSDTNANEEEEQSEQQLTESPAGGAAESLATEETAQDFLSDSEGEDQDSFCDASKDEQANEDYLKKDLGASLHDDELDIDISDDEDVIGEMKARMTIEGGPGDEKEEATNTAEATSD